MLDAAYLGYNVRCLDDQLWDLNLTDADAWEQYTDYITLNASEQKQTKINYLKNLGKQTENSIISKLFSNETLIVMAIDPTAEDSDTIHFYRRDTNGNWSEKQGQLTINLECSNPFISPEIRTSDNSSRPTYKIIGAYAISDPRTTLSK